MQNEITELQLDIKTNLLSLTLLLLLTTLVGCSNFFGDPKENVIRALDDLDAACYIAKANIEQTNFSSISKKEGESIKVENLSKIHTAYTNAEESIEKLIHFADENWPLNQRAQLDYIYIVDLPSQEWCPNPPPCRYSDTLCQLCKGQYMGIEKQTRSSAWLKPGEKGYDPLKYKTVVDFRPFSGFFRVPGQPYEMTIRFWESNGEIDNYYLTNDSKLAAVLSQLWRVQVFVEHAKSVINQSQQGGWSPNK